uniref:EamA domain-containing protein n=1 Tax=Aureoumbra lagunensis TaxID=44058 RepID=A0A7S3JRK7_9STRA|mmetsp:Transcript_16750/g.21771  ORF Transcript_16750/g.21771 Transcript_16750/m.21771 type:complete len:162 (+) Transcript_16750:327-812(+)
MFCLDYALSFGCFAFFQGCASRQDIKLRGTENAFLAAAFSGVGAAFALAPVDIVRQVATKRENQFTLATSTVAFSTVYLGAYFYSTENSTPIHKKALYALSATTVATTIELPFDRAKMSLLGGGFREAIIVSTIRLPVATILLLVFDAMIHGGTLASAPSH